MVSILNIKRVLWLVSTAATLNMAAEFPAHADGADSFQPDYHSQRHHTLYVNANITTGNAVLAFDIQADGSLHALSGSPFVTGGLGFFDPSYALGPFDVDQEMAISNNVLYAVNAGSNSISAMRIAEGGWLYPLRGQPFPSGGSTPVSLGVHGQFLVVVDSAQDPAQQGKGFLPGLSASAIEADGGLRLIPGSQVALSATAQPSQALTTDTGRFVFAAEFPGGGHLDAFIQRDNGRLLATDSTLLPLEPNNVQPLPLGLWAHPRAPYLYVGFVNTSEVGVYTVTDDGKLQFIRKTPNSGQAVCWLRVSEDGRFLYTSNTADNSMSVYDLRNASSPVEIQHVAIGGVGGVQQFSLTPDGRFLYLIQQENSPASAGKSNNVFVLRVDQDSGKLTLLGDLTTKLPVPTNTRPFGIIIQ